MKFSKPLALLGCLVIFAFVVLVGARLCVISIPLGQVGVVNKIYTGGLVMKDYGPGWHLDLGPLYKWELFDATVQTLEMSMNKFHRDTRGGPLTIRTGDGYNIDVDVTIKYRIREGEAHLVLQKKGPGERYKETFMQLAVDACRIVFGQMETEDFYNPEVKEKSSAQAKEILATDKNVSDLSMEVIDVLIRDVRFDPGYEKKIRDKKLADQDALLNQSKGKAAEQKGNTDTIEAGTDALIQKIEAEKNGKLVQIQAEILQQLAEIKAEATKYESQKKSETDLYAAEKRAEGQLLVKTAEAEGERLRNEAMMGAGGRIMVALEAAKNLNLGEMKVSTILNDFLDIDQVVRKLGLSEEDLKAKPLTPKAGQ